MFVFYLQPIDLTGGGQLVTAMMGMIFLLFFILCLVGLVFGDGEHKSVTSYGRSTRLLVHEAVIVATAAHFMWHECFYDRPHIARGKSGKSLEKLGKAGKSLLGSLAVSLGIKSGNCCN